MHSTKKTKKRLITVAAHLLFWVVLSIFYYISQRIAGWSEHYWLHTSWIMPIDLGAVYFTAYYLVPRLLLRQRLVAFIFAFIASVCFFLILERSIYYYFLYETIFPEALQKPLFYLPAFLSIFMGMYSFVFLFCGVRLFRGWLKDKQRQSELEKQSLSSELALLRSQINPHFIFNTLNNIDSLVYIDQDRASDSIVRLSEIMRYMLYEANTDSVPLEKEVHYLESMIDLLRLRLKDPDFIQFNLDGNPAGKTIPPMLLVPFVENAYKHGKKTGPSPGIIINLKINDDSYQFEVINQYEEHQLGGKDEMGGIGLTNVRRRLDLLYGDAYVFYINSLNPNYQTYIEIPSQTILAKTKPEELLHSPSPEPQFLTSTLTVK